MNAIEPKISNEPNYRDSDHASRIRQRKTVEIRCQACAPVPKDDIFHGQHAALDSQQRRQVLKTRRQQSQRIRERCAQNACQQKFVHASNYI